MWRKLVTAALSTPVAHSFLVTPRSRGAFKRLLSSSSSDLEWTTMRTRRTFVEYFEEKGHDFVESSPVVPVGDPTLLFTNAGMNQFKNIFLGSISPSSPLANLKRACNSQKCIRAGGKHNDLEDVGVDTYHHTFFEMLGSWSFGDYFKRDAIFWAFDLLTNVYGLDSARMYATYFGGDESEGLPPDLEAKELWEQFLPKSRVLPGSKKDNFWEMGESGPCGACSELHYDTRGGRGEVPELVNQDDPEVLELWNLVFVEFDRDAKTQKLSPLPAKHVDTGLGLERLVAVLNRKGSNYDTDAFEPLFQGILQLTNAGPYGGLLNNGVNAGSDGARRDTAYRAVADHLRCLVFAIADGAEPSNEGRGYVLRRILRRAARYGRQVLGAKSSENFLADLAPYLADSHFGDFYPEIRQKQSKIQAVLAEEETAFAKTLERGLKFLEDEIEKLDTSKKILSGEAAFFLYDSLGFPFDLTTLMASEKGVEVDEEAFQAQMAAQVARSRADRKKRSGLDADEDVDLSAAQVAALEEKGIAPTEIVSELTYNDAKVVYFFEGSKKGIVGIVLDKTPFYAEGGGQVADIGSIVGVHADFGFQEVLKVRDVQSYGGYVLHVCEGAGLTIKEGATVKAGVDENKRKKIAPNHSMTHLLNHALRQVLGNDVEQKGSYVDDEKLRFDFSYAKALKPEEISLVEEKVNKKITEALAVDARYVSLAKAREISSLRAVFGEAYPDPVRVVAAGCSIADVLERPDSDEWQDYSIELCGGTHVSSTSEALKFVITEETAVAKGIRRIEAVTRDAANFAYERGDILKDRLATLDRQSQAIADDDDLETIGETAKTMRDDLAKAPASLKPLLRAQLDTITKRLGSLQKKRRAKAVTQAHDVLCEAATEASEKGLSFFVVEVPSGVDAKAAALMAQKLQGEHPSLAFFAVSVDANDPSKALAFASVPDERTNNANTWLKAALDPLGGRGGGKPNFAQGSAFCDTNTLMDAAKTSFVEEESS